MSHSKFASIQSDLYDFKGIFHNPTPQIPHPRDTQPWYKEHPPRLPDPEYPDRKSVV